MARRLLPPRDPVTFTFDGRAVQAERGEPIVHALLAAGQQVFIRSAKLHRPRGPFCLRGACDGCLARVDGVPNRMLCQISAKGGEVVESQNSLGSPEFDLLSLTDWLFPSGFDHHRMLSQIPGGERLLIASAKRLAGLGVLPSAIAPKSSGELIDCDALVVGAGPSGLSVANLLCLRGLRTVIVDDSPTDGGSLWAYGAKETEAFLQAHPCASARWLRNSTLVALYGAEAVVAGLNKVSLLRAKSVILACGAHDSPPLCSGNDLPGVMAARAVSRLFSFGIAVGEHIACIGTSSELLTRNLNKYAKILRFDPSELAELGGRNRVSSLRLTDGRSIEIDTLAVDLPRSPSFELAAQAGARIDHDPLRGYVPVSGLDGHLIDTVFCIGECAGSPFDLEAFQLQAARVADAVQAVI